MTSPIIFVLPGNLAPYQVARFNRLFELEIEFEVWILEVKQHARPWSESDTSPRFKTRAVSLCEAIDLLRKMDAGLLIVYGYISVMRALAWRFQLRSWRIGMFIDVFESGNPSLFKEFFKKIFLRCMVDFFIVPGVLQAKYVGSLVGHTRDVALCPLVQEGNLKGIPRPHSNPNYLFVGRFSEEKNLSLLVEAFHKYRRAGGCRSLTLVGDGPVREMLANDISKRNLEGVVTTIPWLSQAELAEVYRKAFAFVLPSRFEPWGVVISEAIQSGLPLIVSSRVGCRLELARDDENCLTFSHFDASELADAFMRVEAFERHQAMGLASCRLAEFYSPECAARDLATAIRKQTRLISEDKVDK
ncbi:glycosyltransferase [Gammaproteobacteria bacterium]|nr:glycosyltransferase [Gammaproteobacteria bacterium]